MSDLKHSGHKHVVSVTVRDQPGVLVRIAGLFARRGFNIESLSVAQSEVPGISRTTFVVSGGRQDARAGPKTAPEACGRYQSD